MSASSIQAKIKKGLAKAISKTGSSSSDLVYVVRETKTGGTLIVAPTITTTDVLLPNAIFKSYNKALFDVNILVGDRQLVSNSDVVISQGDTIKQGTKEYTVIGVDVKAPTSDILAYIAQVRGK